jgi:hypothetical protein
MKPQQGIMSLARPRVSAQDSQAVDQILGNTTQMLGKLDNKTLGLLLQLTQYLKAHKSKYKELMANLEAKGSLPPGVFPDNYDPKFLSVFALSVAKAQQAKNGMAAGGIASIAQTMKDQGRGKDTMLAHISPEEADLLEKRGGVNTINPVTGLPEFGIFDDIGNALSGVGKAVGSVLKPVGDLIGGVLSSPLGLAATAAAAYYFMGPSAGALIPSVAEAAIPGEVAGIGAAAHLTPAAIESGIGSAGYGFNQSAAASGLFDPATIGSGAAIGAPSTTDKLLSANLLKNVKLSPGEEEPASDPNALIKMLMMFEMMNNKQSQPGNAVVPALAENTSNLPYDAPKKPTYPQTRAAEGGLMTKHLGIGGLSANRTQTDYAKNYLRGSGYRPGQGGITYFTPMKYGPNVPEPSLPVEPTPGPIDELVRQTVGKPGGGGMDSESRAAMLADTAKRMDAWEASDPEGYKNRNNWIGKIFDGSLLSGLAKLAAQGIDTVKQTWADNRLRALGIDPKIAIANQNQLAGLSMQQALDSLGQDTTPSFTERSPEQMAGISMQRALESLGQNTTPRTTLGTPNEIAGNDMQNALNSLAQSPNVIAGSDMQRALDLNKVTPAGYTFRPNAVQDALANSTMPEDGFGLPPNAADRYLFDNEAAERAGRTSPLVPTRYEGIVSAADLGSQFPGPVAQPVGYTFQPNAANNLLSSLGLPAENNATVERYLAENQNISPTQYEGIVSAADLGSQFPGLTKTTTQKQADRIKALAAESGGYTPEKDIYGQLIDPQKIVDAYTKQIERQEKAAELAIQSNEPLGELAANNLQKEAERLRTERDAFLNYGGLENQYNAIKYTDPTTRDYKTPFVNYLEEPTPKSEEEQKKELDKIIQSFLSETPSSFFGPATLLAGTDYTGGIPSTTIGDYSFGREPIGPDTSGLNLGSLDSNQLKETFPGAFNPFEASLAVTVYGPDGTEYGSPAQAMANGVTNYSMSPPADPSAGTYYDNSLAGDKGFAATGGFGNSWRSADGTPIRTADGFALQTGQGAAQESSKDKVDRIVREARIAAGEDVSFSGPVFGSTPPAPAPEAGPEAAPPTQAAVTTVDNSAAEAAARAEAQARAVVASNEAADRMYGRSADTGPANDGRSDPGGEGGTRYGRVAEGYGGGSEAATGGLSTPYGFQHMAHGGIAALYNLGSYSDGGRLLKGPGDGVSDSIPATIGQGQPARLADGEFVIPARIVSELGNGSTDAGAKRLYEMMDRIQKVRRKTKNVAANTKAAKYLPA